MAVFKVNAELRDEQKKKLRKMKIGEPDHSGDGVFNLSKHA
jgi:hypothetical protein